MATKTRRRPRILWSAKEVRQLRRMSRRFNAKQIGRTLGRSTAAVRYKAWAMGLRLVSSR